ncbi:MAG: pirin family protein [Bacteroidetes bacterium]|nr:pirin family protein [Bacteroidota bacterium]
MDRKKFLKNSLLGAAGIAVGKTLIAAEKHNPKSTHDKLMQQVGFNHLPNQKTEKTMKSVLHKASTRGHANHGWLDTHHTFSFASYYNPERMNFGVLRVLNDDRVSAGKGFGTHPHDNMEIISIPLEGDLEHKDSMGNTAVIKQGDVQVMSAGTGIYHSEYNKNSDSPVKFLQIWMFPNKRNVAPRYDQITLDKEKLKNDFHQILSPEKDDDGVWVHQNAWFHLGNFDKDKSKTYTWKDESNGLYVFVLEGEVTVGDQKLDKRDGYGLWDTSEIEITANTNAKLLLMEVPLQLNQQ